MRRQTVYVMGGERCVLSPSPWSTVNRAGVPNASSRWLKDSFHFQTPSCVPEGMVSWETQRSLPPVFSSSVAVPSATAPELVFCTPIIRNFMILFKSPPWAFTPYESGKKKSTAAAVGAFALSSSYPVQRVGRTDRKFFANRANSAVGPVNPTLSGEFPSSFPPHRSIALYCLLVMAEGLYRIGGWLLNAFRINLLPV